MTVRSLIALIALALAPACGFDDDDDDFIVDDDEIIEETLDIGFEAGEDLADLALDELIGNDYLVQIGITATTLATLNDTEIDQADFAAQVVNGPDIFDFANALIREHEGLNVQLDGTLRVYGVGYLPSDTADVIAAESSVTIGAMRDASELTVDFVYVESQVINHAAALVLLDQLYDVIGPGAMGDYILDAIDRNDVHLAEAEDLYETFF